MKRTIPILLAIVLAPASAGAWGNRSAHPAINKEMFKVFETFLASVPGGVQIDPNARFSGEAVTAGGKVSISTGTRTLEPSGWVAHGGWSADEPEIAAAWRHLYDPHAANGVTYVTDHVPDGWGINPQIDAKDWALHRDDNPWGWKKVFTAFKDGMEGREPEKSFATSWRAMGETLHLLADMVQPAHVRNDAHALDEPLEDTVDRKIVEAVAGGAVDPVVVLDGADPDTLFLRLAVFANLKFYSRDSIWNPDDPAVLPANGQTPNARPVFADLTCQGTGNEPLHLYQTVAGVSVPVAAERYSSWIARTNDPTVVPSFTVWSFWAREQAAALIPIAVQAGARLLAMLPPSLSVGVWAVCDSDWEMFEDDKPRTVRIFGNVTHYPAGPWSAFEPIKFTGSLDLMEGYPPGSTDGAVGTASRIGEVTVVNGEVTSSPTFTVNPGDSDRGPLFVRLRAGGFVWNSGAFWISYCYTGCVAPGTPVRMADGSERPIEDVRVGDEVLGYVPADGLSWPARVERTIEHREGPYDLDTLLVDGGGELRLTGNHPIWTVSRGFVPVDEVEPGEVVRLLDPLTGLPQERVVLGIVRSQSTSDVVYNLKTSMGHYYAADILVHNKCLAAGSRIDTPSGPVAVERLVPGDVVWGTDGRGNRVVTRVTAVHAKRTVLGGLPGVRLGPDLTVTANHRVLRDGAAIEAGSLPAPAEVVPGVVYDLSTGTGDVLSGGVRLEAAPACP